MRKNFNWNRKWVRGERSYTSNKPSRESEGWKRGGRLDREFKGDRNVDIRKESFRSQHTNPSLEGVGIGKDRVSLGDENGVENAGRKYAATNIPKSQESMESEKFIFNIRQEVNFLPMDQMGGGLVDWKGLGQAGSIGLVTVGYRGGFK